MTREEFMQDARLNARKILADKEYGIMNLVEQAYAEGRRQAKREEELHASVGAESMKAAVDAILDVMSYDAKALFGAHNETMAVKLIHDMSADEVFAAKKRIDEWVKEQVGEYEVGMVARDPMGNACVITKIYTGRTAGVMGGFHVLYAGGDTNRWPLGTKFEVLEDDGGALSELSEAISLADGAETEA